MSETSLLNRLIDSLRCLPGVGPKTAQRMAFHLLERDRSGATLLASTLQQSVEQIGQCRQCRTLTEKEVCEICSNPGRDSGLLCIVEHPTDVIAIEASTQYRGFYFILMGRLSPLDGIGPEELGFDSLEMRLASGEVKELILATNPTVEGEVTANYIHEMARHAGVQTSRIAHGVPFGGELEYVDGQTLAHAFDGRTNY
ncbi:MAG TPA: recombination protein RecR [Gammaproteobacteria bacterium]|nr:recombination protein RecR [Gammaproteobacteria bacterium]